MDMPINQSPLAKARGLMKLFIKITGVDEETLETCPRHDWDTVRALGEIMILTWIYQTALFALVGHQLFASRGQFRIDIVLVAMFIATFILSIDSFLFYRSGWHLSGIDHLLQGGLDIAVGLHARIKANVFLAVRLVLSVGIAQLTAVFVSLLIFAGDIHARIEDTYLKANAHLISPAAAPIDAEIKRETDAVGVQTERVNELTAQIAALRQHQVDPESGNPQIREAEAEVSRLTVEKTKAEEDVTKAEAFAANEYGGIRGAPGNSGLPGYGLRYRAAMEQVTQARGRTQKIDADLTAARARLDALRQPGSAANEIQRAHDQLPDFEKGVDAETAKLADLKKQFAALIAGREGAIRRAVENAPDHVGYDDGFLARIRVLGQIAGEDGKIASVIILIDIVSFGFELAAVLAKVTSYVPTAYAAFLARDAHLRFARIVDEIISELKTIDGWDPKWPEFLDPNKSADGEADAKLVPDPEPPPDSNPQPAKRGWGRPRKHPLPGQGLSNANGQGHSVPPRDPKESA
jgi:Domain of unknown function (DUF4407)